MVTKDIRSEYLPHEYLAKRRDFLTGNQLLGVTVEIMGTFARERARLRLSSQIIPGLDLPIIATALTHDLVTRNVRHFQRVDGLRLFASSS